MHACMRIYRFVHKDVDMKERARVRTCVCVCLCLELQELERLFPTEIGPHLPDGPLSHLSAATGIFRVLLCM